MNLYRLTEAQHALHTRLELAGFDEQTIADSLEGDDNTDALREKRLGYVAIIKNKRALSTMFNLIYFVTGKSTPYDKPTHQCSYSLL